MSLDRTTPGESLCPGMERLQRSHSVLGWNDSRGVNLSWMKQLQGSHSVLGWNDSRGVILSWDGTTTEESFCPGMERLQGSQSVLGWNESRESFCLRMEGLQGSHSVLGWNDSKGIILSWVRTTPGESFRPGME